MPESCSLLNPNIVKKSGGKSEGRTDLEIRERERYGATTRRFPFQSDIDKRKIGS
jgi:hypothetical protein